MRVRNSQRVQRTASEAMKVSPKTAFASAGDGIGFAGRGIIAYQAV